MKKIFIGLSLVIGSFAFSQINDSEKMKIPSNARFGIKAGVNSSSFTKSDLYTNQSSVNNFYFGVYKSIPLSDLISIQPELLYSGYGAKIDYIEPIFEIYRPDIIRDYVTKSEKISLGFITIPVMLQLNFNQYLYFEVGPELEVLIYGKEKGSREYESLGLVKEDYKETARRHVYKSLNLGYKIGVGSYITDNIGISVGFVGGISKLHTDQYTDSKVKNNTFQLGVMYRF